MPCKKFSVMLSALVLSVSLFADGIECPGAKAIIQGCPSMAAMPEQQWVSNQGNPFMATQFSGDADSRTVTGTNEPFLWGLIGFGLTVVSGVVGLSIGGQGSQEYERVPKVLECGTIGSLIGAGVSLTSSLIFSQGYQFTPTCHGILAGFGTLILIAVAMYPEIPGAFFAAALFGPFFSK